jgi:hypothetical protein
LDLVQLLGAGWIPGGGLDQELSVDLDYGEQVVELVGDKSGCLVGLFEITGSRRRIDCWRALLVLSRGAARFLQ